MKDARNIAVNAVIVVEVRISAVNAHQVRLVARNFVAKDQATVEVPVQNLAANARVMVEAAARNSAENAVVLEEVVGIEVEMVVEAAVGP